MVIGNPSNIEEERQKLSYEVAVYREQLRLLQREMERITLTLLDLKNAEKTASNLKDGSSLVPIGGGAFLNSEINSHTLLVPVGAGYLVQMGREEAARELARRIESTEKALHRLEEEFGGISGKLNSIGTKLNTLQSEIAINKRVEENIGEDYL